MPNKTKNKKNENINVDILSFHKNKKFLSNYRDSLSEIINHQTNTINYIIENNKLLLDIINILAYNLLILMEYIANKNKDDKEIIKIYQDFYSLFFKANNNLNDKSNIYNNLININNENIPKS